MPSEWNVPPAANEAKFILPLARKYGVRAARDLISVSQREQEELLQWAAADPLLIERIVAVIRWRERVLCQFDRLVGNGEN
jgi:hypothetical protein